MRSILMAAMALMITLPAPAQDKAESLKVLWPEEYKWKVASNQEDQTTHFMEIIPGNESLNNWTMLGTMMSMKGAHIASAEDVVTMYRESSLKESPKAKLTVLEKDEKAKPTWVLFKVETPEFPGDPSPESQLYYAVQGESALYVNFIAVKQKSLAADFVTKWGKVFKDSKLVYE